MIGIKADREDFWLFLRSSGVVVVVFCRILRAMSSSLAWLAMFLAMFGLLFISYLSEHATFKTPTATPIDSMTNWHLTLLPVLRSPLDLPRSSLGPHVPQLAQHALPSSQRTRVGRRRSRVPPGERH